MSGGRGPASTRARDGLGGGRGGGGRGSGAGATSDRFKRRRTTPCARDGDAAPAPPGAYAPAPPFNDADPAVDSRPDATDADERVKTRGRRMFAGLLGTLRRHREDEKKLSAVTAQRNAIVERVETRAREESEALIRRQRGGHVKRRATAEAARARLDVEMCERELELVPLTAAEREEKLEGGALRTVAENKPRVYYKPKKHTEATERKANEAVEEVRAWKEKQEKYLREKIERIKEALAHKEAMIEEYAAYDDDDEEEEEGDAMDDAVDDAVDRGGDGEEEEEEEGEVGRNANDAASRRRARGGKEAETTTREDDDEEMGEIEEAADPEGLEEVLGK